MERPANTYRTASWAVLAVAVILGAGGLIYDAVTPVDEPNLMWLYLSVTALALAAGVLAYRGDQRRRGADDGSR